MQEAPSQLFYNLMPREVTKAVIFSCFDRIDQLKKRYKPYVKKEFRGYYSGLILKFEYNSVTVIISGPGDSRVGDAVLALQNTPCEYIVYTGAVGSIFPALTIGDLFSPTKALIGEGFSRYYSQKNALNNFSFASTDLLGKFKIYAVKKKCNVYFGHIFTTETLFKQTPKELDKLTNKFIHAIDMETSAFFTAAAYLGLKPIAIHYVSDLPYENRGVDLFNIHCRRIYVNIIHMIIDFTVNDLK